MKCNGPLENAHTLLKKETTVFIQTCIKKYLHLHTLLFKFFYYNSKHYFISAYLTCMILLFPQPENTRPYLLRLFKKTNSQSLPLINCFLKTLFPYYQQASCHFRNLEKRFHEHPCKDTFLLMFIFLMQKQAINN